MKELVFNYAPVRFLPYREIGEFVNVGIVVHCPQTGYFGYRLAPLNRTGRVKGFFPELDVEVFKAALQGLERELAHRQENYQSAAKSGPITPETSQRQIGQFQEMVRPREGLLHFGDAGTLLAATPEQALPSLFDRFVERQFAQRHEYQETVTHDR